MHFSLHLLGFPWFSLSLLVVDDTNFLLLFKDRSLYKQQSLDLNIVLLNFNGESYKEQFLKFKNSLNSPHWRCSNVPYYQPAKVNIDLNVRVSLHVHTLVFCHSPISSSTIHSRVLDTPWTLALTEPNFSSIEGWWRVFIT